METKPKHTVKMNRDFFKVRKWNILKQPNQSPAFNSIVDVLHLKKIKVKSGQKDRCRYDLYCQTLQAMSDQASGGGNAQSHGNP